METQLGSIKLVLYEENAPVTVHNFLHYVDAKMYDGQGFAAFGKVVSGMEIVRKIQQMPADSNQLLLTRVRIDRVYRRLEKL
jgi:cyclophilin family peptidyl-prolyl cis-trans isomerase